LTEIVLLKVGEEHFVKLDGLGSAGYLWDFVVEQGSTLLTVESVQTEKTAIGSGATPTSSSIPSSFVIKALAPGQARVHFTLQRPWLVGKMAPFRDHLLEITIQ